MDEHQTNIQLPQKMDDENERQEFTLKNIDKKNYFIE